MLVSIFILSSTFAVYFLLMAFIKEQTAKISKSSLPDVILKSVDEEKYIFLDEDIMTCDDLHRNSHFSKSDPPNTLKKKQMKTQIFKSISKPFKHHDVGLLVLLIIHLYILIMLLKLRLIRI
jgi:hypothetical protein